MDLNDFDIFDNFHQNGISTTLDMTGSMYFC